MQVTNVCQSQTTLGLNNNSNICKREGNHRVLFLLLLMNFQAKKKNIVIKIFET